MSKCAFEACLCQAAGREKYCSDFSAGKREARQTRRADPVFKRKLTCLALAATGLMLVLPGCRSDRPSEARQEGISMATVHYLEIVCSDVEALTAVYQRVHGLSFGPPDPDLGQARVAARPDGTLVGIRKPLAAHEQPVVRAYFEVEDIQRAVKEAEDSGATVAYPPTRQGQRGTFAIVFHGDVQHGLWQR